jgi:hypothetical protein
MDVAGHLPDGSPDGCTDPGCVAAAQRGDRWLGPHLSLEPDGGGRSRGHFHHRDILHETVRQQRDDDFVAICARLTDRPDDPAVAWTYLRHHPIFWRPAPPRHLDVDIAELSATDLARATDARWLVDTDGLRNLDLRLGRGDDGTLQVSLEHGPHLWVDDITPGDWTYFAASGQATCDPRLNVQAATYEDAVVALAARVRAVYGDDRSRVAAAFTARPDDGADSAD